MIFSRDFPNKIRSIVSIVAVVSKKVKLKAKGKDFTGLCPFHNEKTPSFSVNTQKNFYYCFGCGAGGDIIKFVAETEKLNFNEAVIKIAQDFNIAIPQQQKININHNQQQLLTLIAQIFQKNLKNNLVAYQYIDKRGINPEICNLFQIGFANDSYSELVNILHKKNFSDQDLLETGIFSQKNGKIFSKMKNRIMFPIFDQAHQVIAFGGRCLDNSLPKYLNSAETTLFKKSQTLYNFSLAKKHIYQQQFAILSEGYIDVISLYQHGFCNAVSALGTAVSSDHLQQLFAITNKIIVCLDGDNAGKRAANRLVDIALPLITTKKAVYFVFLPNNLDPDDFLKQNKATGLQDLINNAIPLSQAIFDSAISQIDINNNSAEKKIILQQYFDEKLKLITNNICKKHFASFFQDKIFFLGKKNHKNYIETPQLPKSSFTQQEKLILIIVSFLIKFPNLIDYEDEYFNLRELEFNHKNLSECKDFVIDASDRNQKIIELLANSQFSCYVGQINENMSQPSLNENNLETKFKITLLKNFCLELELQYQQQLQSLNISGQKLNEIANYKNSINNLIFQLEQQIFL
jgi:DNA primase